MSTLSALALSLVAGLSFLFGFLVCWILQRRRRDGGRPGTAAVEAPRPQTPMAEPDLLRRAQHLARLGHWVWWPDPGSSDWLAGRSEYSEAAAGIFGLKPADLAVSNRVFLDRFVHPEDHGPVGAAYANILEPGRGSYEIEYRILRADGEIRTIHEIAENVYGDGGVLLYSVGTLQDVTERAQAEAALRESQALLRAVVDTAPATINVKDRDGRYVLVNAYQAKYHDQPVEWFRGRRPADIYDPAYADWLLERDRQIIESGAALAFQEQDYTTRDGRQTRWLMSRAPILDVDGKVSHIVSVGIDITERHRAEAALRESEAVLRHAQRMARLSYWISTTKSPPGDLPVMITRYGAGAAEIFGVTPAELEAPDRDFIARFIHPDDRAVALANYERYLGQIADVARTGVAPVDYGGGYRIVRPDGEVRHLSEIVESAFAEDGSLRYTIGTIQDITERKRSEAALAESRALLREVIDSVPATIAVRDVAGRYVFVNEALAKYHGRPVEWFPGQSPQELYPEDYVNHIRTADRAVAESGERMDFRESDYREASGRLRTWLASRAPIRGADGQVKYVVSTGLDITERKQAEAARRESEGRFRMIADSLPALVWMSDEKGDCIFLNRQWSDYTGRPVEDELGRGFVDSIHPDDRAHSVEIEKSILTRRVKLADEYRLRGKDGSYRWFLDTMVPRFAPDGSYLGHAGVLIDIDDRRSLEEQLRQVQRLEAVGQMTGGIAHDFNNLLTVVIGNLDLICEYPSNAAAVGSLADMALRAARRGAELVHRMVAFSRQQMLKPRQIELNRLIGDAREMLRRSLTANIELEMRLAPDLWTARADPGEVEGSLLNLALNARDAMPAGGRLVIETANVTLAAGDPGREPELAPGDYVVLTVSDTGVGMTPEVLARAVQPFFTTKEVGKGSGLGLSMVYGFAKQSGGHMKIISEAGHGCTVKLYLPRFIGAVDAAVEGPRAGPLGGRETILVVEDDEMVRSYVVEQLRSLGYDILEARDGNAALALIRDGQRFDLMFTDVMLPGGLLGPQLLAEARAEVPGLKALFTSGYTEGAALFEPSDEAVRLLRKPYSRQNLAACVRAALDAKTA